MGDVYLKRVSFKYTVEGRERLRTSGEMSRTHTRKRKTRVLGKQNQGPVSQTCTWILLNGVRREVSDGTRHSTLNDYSSLR